MVFYTCHDDPDLVHSTKKKNTYCQVSRYIIFSTVAVLIDVAIKIMTMSTGWRIIGASRITFAPRWRVFRMNIVHKGMEHL